MTNQGLSADFIVDRNEFQLDCKFSVAPGEVLALVGPNGAGKSTALQSISGLISITSGEIKIGGQVLDSPAAHCFIPANNRNIGVVFQNYALFPHLSVSANVAFGPRSRGVSKAQARESTDAILAQFDLVNLARRRPAELSGGQAQRVALARAVVTSPDALLLDEPLSALDAVTAGHVRNELGKHLKRFQGSAIIVTHNPLDALLLADNIAILENGQITQVGTPSEIAQSPRTDYAATLMGVTLIRGTATNGVIATPTGEFISTDNSQLSGSAAAIIRPDTVSVHLTMPEGSPRNVWAGEVSDIQQTLDRVRLVIRGAVTLSATITPASLSSMDLQVGSRVWTSVKAIEVAGVSLD